MNPVLGIVLMMAALQVIGYALARITGDEDWYDVFEGFGLYAGGALFMLSWFPFIFLNFDHYKF